MVGEVFQSEAMCHAYGHQRPGGMSLCANHTCFEFSILSASSGRKTPFCSDRLLFLSQNDFYGLSVNRYSRRRGFARRGVAGPIVRRLPLPAPAAWSKISDAFFLLSRGRAYVRLVCFHFTLYPWHPQQLLDVCLCSSHLGEETLRGRGEAR